MDERGAHIDLAFRNGLKDFEVLPPPVVWDNINSRLGRKRRPIYFLRAAAFLAIAMSLSVLAYKWTGRTSSVADSSSMALNSDPFATQDITETEIPAVAERKTERLFKTTIKEQPVKMKIVPDIVAVENTAPEIATIPERNGRLTGRMTVMNIVSRQPDMTVAPNASLALDNINLQFKDYISVDNIVQSTERWSIAALASPTYYGKLNFGSDAQSKQIMSSEQAIVSYSGGVALSYKVNKRLSIQSGLFYSSVGQELDGINSFAGFRQYDYTKGDHNFEVMTTNGTVFTNNGDVFLMDNSISNRLVTTYNNDVFDPNKANLEFVSSNMKQTFSYLELPIILRYKVIDKAIDFNLIGGMSYNMLVDNSVYSVVDGNRYAIGTTQGLNMFSISSSIGMGMEYNFSDKLSLNLEPTFRYYLNSFNNVSGSNFHPYSFGIFSGVSYKF
jgi:hypothetical protein